MGQVADKCTCLCNLDKNTVYLGNTSENYTTNSITNIKSKNPVVLKYPLLSEPTNLEKFKKLQAFICNRIKRIKFKKIKQKLIEQNELLITSLISEFKYKSLSSIKTSNSSIISTSIAINELSTKQNIGIVNQKISYNQNGWRRFYPNGDKIFNCRYGKTYKTKLLFFDDFKSYYRGDINAFNEKHGYGILECSDGAKYEGHWEKNKFTGWNCFTSKEGVVYIGKFYFN